MTLDTMEMCGGDMSVTAIETLCCRDDAFGHSSQLDQLFLEAMRENYLLQWERQPFVRWLGERAGFGPDQLQEYADIFRIPPLFVGTMKQHPFNTVPESEIVLTLTSSGTAGQKTRTFMDRASLARLERLSRAVFKAAGYQSDIPAHLFIFNYDPSHAADVGTAWSAEQKAALTPALSKQWTILWDEQKQAFDFDPRRWAEALLAVPPDQPVRLIGFPAFIYRCVLELCNLNPAFRVHPQSFVICGGGWKNHQGEVLTHRDFAGFLERSIGLPAKNVRDIFGMAEHGIPYAACAEGRHHLPVYGRLAVVDPLSLRPLALGEEGLLQLLTPFNTAQSNLSVLATDLAVLADNCPCGLAGSYIASIRRGGVRKYKGCAIAAQEILNRAGGQS